MKKQYKIALIILASPIVGFIGLIIAAQVYLHFDNARIAKAAAASAAAEAARIAADPVTADNIYNHVNKARTDNGVPALARNAQLNTSAQQKCDDMAQNNYYAHNNPTTGKPGYEYIQANIQYYLAASENLSSGRAGGGGDIVNGWLGSPAHKAAMLDPKYTDTGLATCTVLGKSTVVQHFIKAYVAPAQTTVVNRNYYQAKSYTSPTYVKPYTPPRSINCTSNSMGNTTYTSCN